MAVRNLVRAASQRGFATPTSAPIRIDTTTNTPYYNGTGSGTTEIEILDGSSAQVVAGKIFSSTHKVLAAQIDYASTVTAALITGFAWTVVAGATYIFEMNLPITATTVGGLTLSYKLTTATLASIQYQSYASTASDNSTAVSTQGTTTTDATKVFDSKTAAYTYVRIVGSMVFTLGGTFSWFGCQNTSAGAGDTTSLLIGGYSSLIRVV